MAISSLAVSNSPRPETGSIHTIRGFKSDYVSNRQIDIWLPNGFNLKQKQKYAVLYMHDGQNLFDTRFGYHGQIWAADVAMQKLLDQNKVKPTIIVGIWNTPGRFAEYLPAPAFNGLSKYQQYILTRERSDTLLSDAYLRFLVEELKPYIDAHYPVITDPSHTFIAGSSMGGLISAYALAAYPEVFGGAACFSTHWPLSTEENDLAFSRPFMLYLAEHLPKPDSHKIYFDHGTETLDVYYEKHQRVMDSVMHEKGYVEGVNLLSRKFEGHAHNEAAWRSRMHIALEFLLGNL